MKKKNVKVPHFSDEKVEANIIDILKKNGSLVSKKELIIKIETEKIVIDIISPCNGYFYTKNRVGDKVFPGNIIAHIYKKKKKNKSINFIKENVVDCKNVSFDREYLTTTFNEIDVTNLIDLRKEILFYKKKVSLTSFFIKAAYLMLKKNPVLNFNSKKKKIEKEININIAISSLKNDSLFTPVIKKCYKKTVYEISNKLEIYKNRILDGSLKSQNGTFTLSNGGIYGSMLSTPILNGNQTSIIGTHCIKKRVIVIKKKIKIRDIMYVAMTYNHRYIKGKNAILGLELFKNFIEKPTVLL